MAELVELDAQPDQVLESIRVHLAGHDRGHRRAVRPGPQQRRPQRCFRHRGHRLGLGPRRASGAILGPSGRRLARRSKAAAGHSCAVIEAEECGLVEVLRREFEPTPQAFSSALTFCDMTTSPGGKPVIVDWRLAEIHRRYGSGHLVSRSIHRATPMILDAVDEVQAKSSQNCLGPLRSWGTQESDCEDRSQQRTPGGLDAL